ncbi:MAG TPA: alpha/beta fold hydrolase [Pseudomonadota bacterium]|jgi:alpha/beta superfamily hydrolase|nr:alpha/beta fold hydrolase [Pseudomonadota bacterium]
MQPAAFPQASGPLLLQGGAGAIEAAVDWPTTMPNRDVVGVVCHPHPLHGGTMTNKVVTSAAQALRELGCATLRFNFRGTGQSAGEHDDGLGEGADLVAICDWIRATRPGAQLVLAGFSFGAYVSMMRAAEIHPDVLVSLAPSVGRRDVAGFREPACPWLVIQPDADEVVDPAEVRAWVAQRHPAPTLVRFDGASHFFHGRLLELRATISHFVGSHLPPPA